MPRDIERGTNIKNDIEYGVFPAEWAKGELEIRKEMAEKAMSLAESVISTLADSGKKTFKVGEADFEVVGVLGLDGKEVKDGIPVGEVFKVSLRGTDERSRYILELFNPKISVDQVKPKPHGLVPEVFRKDYEQDTWAGFKLFKGKPEDAHDCSEDIYSNVRKPPILKESWGDQLHITNPDVGIEVLEAINKNLEQETR